MRRTAFLIAVTILACLSAGTAQQRAELRLRPLPTRGTASFPSPSDYLRVIERFPLYAERGWHDGYRGDRRLGYFGDGRSDENGQRTLANFIMTYAFLATNRDYDADVSGVASTTLRAHALQAIRYVLHTHVTGDLPCTDGKPWGDHWQSAWWTSRFLCGAELLRDDLSADETSRIERLVVHEADRHIGLKPRDNEYLDTKAEENAWDSEVLAWALNLYPDHPHVPRWRAAFDQLCLNTFCVAADMNDTRLADGKPVKEWIGGPCVHPDFTIENHGFFHICYMACPLHSLAWDYYVFRRCGHPVPAVLYHHTKDVWNRLKQFALWNGRFAYAGGKDWPRYAYGLYFIMPALVWFQNEFHDADARLIEGWRLQTFDFEQRLYRDGSFFSGRFTHLQMDRWPAEWETDAAANLTIACLLHQWSTPLAPATRDELNTDTDGVFISPYSELSLCRSPQRFASWCWKSHGGPVTGAICSDHGEDLLEWDHSLCGSISLTGVKPSTSVVAHNEIALHNGFTTTGIVYHGRVSTGLSPWRLVVVDDNVPTGPITAPTHPLFNSPHRITSLASLTDLDSITTAGPSWQVLARNVRGGPSLLETRIGRGRFLISMTNMEERCAAGDPLSTQLMENLLAYLHVSGRRVAYIAGESHLRDALDAWRLKTGAEFHYEPLQRLDRRTLSKYDVLFIDRTADSVRDRYPVILDFVSAGGMVFESIIQDVGWNADNINTESPHAVEQRLSWSVLPDGRTAVLISEWRAAVKVCVTSLDLLDWRIANDIFNGNRRTIASADVLHHRLTLLGVDGPGCQTRLNSTWISIDSNSQRVQDDLGAVVVTSGARFVVNDLNQRLAPSRSLCYAQIRLIPAQIAIEYAAGSTIARAIVVFRTYSNAGQTAALAAACRRLPAAWRTDSVTATIPGADGHRYRIMANFGAAPISTAGPSGQLRVDPITTVVTPVY